MKVLILAAGSRGDVQPLIAFAIKIRDKGHQVLLAAPLNFETWIKSFGFDFLEYSHDVQKIMEEHAAVVGDHPIKLLEKFFSLLRNELVLQFNILMEKMKDFDIVIGAAYQLAAPFIAEVFNKPYYFLIYSTNALPSMYHPPFLLPFETKQKIINKALWFANQEIFNLVLKKQVNIYRKQLGLIPLKNYLDPFLTLNLILALDEEIAPLPPDLKGKVKQVGSFHLFTEEKLSDDLNSFLEGDKPVIYIGFGSMTDPTPEKTTALIVEAVKKTKVKALISKGWSGLGNFTFDNENIKLIDSISHHALFPKLSGVVHHGGAGTTSTTAFCGVPQIIVPHLMDQYHFGNRIYERELGAKPISRNKLTSENLAQAITYIISNKRVKENAKELRKQLLQKDPLEKAYKIIFEP